MAADEIRKLAENSSNESQKIGAELKQIVETINRIVKNAKAAEESFSQVSLRVDETGKLVQEVDNAIREQKEGAGRVIEALKVMNDITAEAAPVPKKCARATSPSGVPDAAKVSVWCGGANILAGISRFYDKRVAKAFPLQNNNSDNTNSLVGCQV